MLCAGEHSGFAQKSHLARKARVVWFVLFRVTSWIVSFVQENQTIHEVTRNKTKLVTTETYFSGKAEHSKDLTNLLAVHSEMLGSPVAR